jgi:hypothetical protein
MAPWAVAFRDGSASGRLGFGWLPASVTSNGRVGELTVVATLLGKPSLAVDTRRALCAVAARHSEHDPWRIHLATLAAGESQAHSTPLALPRASHQGAGDGAIAPRIAMLDGERTLLQWTEGKAGAHLVRVVTLDQHSKMLGPAVDLSRPDLNAGSAALAVATDRALALYWARTGAGYQLWARRLSCR